MRTQCISKIYQFYVAMIFKYLHTNTYLQLIYSMHINVKLKFLVRSLKLIFRQGLTVSNPPGFTVITITYYIKRSYSVLRCFIYVFDYESETLERYFVSVENCVTENVYSVEYKFECYI